MGRGKISSLMEFDTRLVFLKKFIFSTQENPYIIYITCVRLYYRYLRRAIIKSMLPLLTLIYSVLFSEP